MKIINPGVEYIPQSNNTLKGIFEQIEKAGRTCYKSEDKITEDSAEAFVQRMIKSNHTAMLEHGTVYMSMHTYWKEEGEIVHYPWYNNNAPCKYREIFGYVQYLFHSNPYSIVNLHYDNDNKECIMCITTNYRVIIENHWEDIMKEFICEPTEYHTPRITLKFTTNIGVTREGNRMRANSIAEESTRYCNYNKDKFNNQITFCKPDWIDIFDTIPSEETFIEEFSKSFINRNCTEFVNNCTPGDIYRLALLYSEFFYITLINKGWKPQQARDVLPLATKSDVVYTAFPHQWRHFFDLRLFSKTGIPHPNMKAIASLARDILCEKDLWYLIYKPNEPEFSAHQVGEDAAPKQD